jgi:hypothetical protein
MIRCFGFASGGLRQTVCSANALASSGYALAWSPWRRLAVMAARLMAAGLMAAGLMAARRLDLS